MRDRRAEQREDAVAGRLHHVAVVAMHRVDHQLERRIDQARASSGSRSSISSIEPLMSANSAVTVLRSPSSASAAASGFTRIAELSGSALIVDAAVATPSVVAAFPAEFEGRGVLGATLRAPDGEGITALTAEFSAARILRPAF